jgi:hypothetical protein
METLATQELDTWQNSCILQAALDEERCTRIYNWPRYVLPGSGWGA